MVFSIVYVTGNFCVLYEAVTPICIHVGSCLLFISFVKDIKNDLNVLKVEKSYKKNSTELKTGFFRIVQTYSKVKELSD